MPDKEMIRISNSEIGYWADCKRKWMLAYWRGLAHKEKKFTGPLAMGDRVHKALEIYYQSAINDEPIDLLEAHSDLIEADRLELAMEGRDPSDLDKEADLSRIMLSGYLEWVAEEGIDANLDVLAVESRLEHVIIPDRVIMTGKVDLLLRDRRNGNIEISDWKTAVSPDKLLVTADISSQLKTYVALNLALHPDEKNGLTSGSYRILRKVKRTARARPPFYILHEVRFNLETLRTHWVHMYSNTTAIADARDRLDRGESHHMVAPPSVSDMCTWKCPFRNACQLFNEDAAAAEEFVSDNYVVADPRAYLTADALVEHIKKGKGKNA